MIALARSTAVTLGEFVQRRRRQLGLTREQVMQRIPDRSLNWLVRIEQNDVKNLPDPPLLAQLADALEVSQLDLIRAFGYEPEPEGDRPKPERPTIYSLIEDVEQIDDLPPEARNALLADLELALRLKEEIERPGRNSDNGQ